MKKQALTAAFISVLLSAVLAGLQSTDSASAQPHVATEPPVITVLSPENNTCVTNNITLSFRAKVGKDLVYGVLGDSLSLVQYKGDWQQNETIVYERDEPQFLELRRSATFSLNLTEVPEGNHNITFYAREIVWTVFHTSPVYYESVSSVNFTVDAVPPSVLVLSPRNSWYTTGDVSLNFTVSEAVSQVAYSLDGNANVRIAGDTLLSGLAVGEHNVTVYAWDEAGNVGASETVYFTVTESSPTVLVIAASGVFLAVAGVGLIIYFKKRKR